MMETDTKFIMYKTRKAMNEKLKLFKQSFISLLIISLFLLNLSLVLAADTTSTSFSGGYGSDFGGGYRVYGPSSNMQFSNPSFYNTAGFTSPEVYWPKFNQQSCYERQDFIMQIAPGGCSPAVVRSDLLEEQPVPVFCKVMMTQVNPLIDVSKIRSLHFKEDYPPGVQSISYFPARAALRSQTSLVSSPVNDNLGYLVIVLKQIPAEKNMPDFVEGKVTATIQYDVQGAFGIGRTAFYAGEMTDEEWLRDYQQYGFWNGKAYLRADSIESDRATLSVYKDSFEKQTTVTLMKGETSRDLYLSGFYCAAGLTMTLDNIQAPVDSVLLQINDEQVWVAKNDKILDKRCLVKDIVPYGGGGKVSISCPVQNGKFDLSLNPGKATLKIGKDAEAKDYAMGDRVNGSIWLGYVGIHKNENFVVLVNDSYSKNTEDFSNKNVYSIIEEIVNDKKNKEINIDDLKKDIENKIYESYTKILGKTTSSNAIKSIIKIEIVKKDKPGFGIYLESSLVAKDKDWAVVTDESEKIAKEYYDEAIKYYEELYDVYPKETQIDGSNDDPYAAEGLYNAARLSKQFGMNEKAVEFYNKLMNDYPNTDVAQTARRDKELLMKYDTSESKAAITINNVQYYIDLINFKSPKKSDLNVVLNIGGVEETLGLNEVYDVDKSKNITIKIGDIKDEYVRIDYTESGSSSSKPKVLKDVQGENQFLLGTSNIRLVKINMNKQVKLSINPKNYGPRTESNFSFKIGIEKRAIKLSPEKTQEMMDNLDETIKTWDDINNKLGKVIQGLKGACFATSAMLTVKNLFSGWNGESMARNDVMTKSGGWNDRCERWVSAGTKSDFNKGPFASVQDCIFQHTDEINNDVKVMGDAYKTMNERIEKIRTDAGINVTKSDWMDIQGQIDSAKMSTAIKDDLIKDCEAIGGMKLPGKDNSTTFSKEACKTATSEQLRDLVFYSQLKNSGGIKNTEVINNQLGSLALDVQNYYEYDGSIKKAQEEASKYNLGIQTTRPAGDPTTAGFIKRLTTSDFATAAYKGFAGEKSPAIIRVEVPTKKQFGDSVYTADSSIAGKTLIVQVKDTGNGNYKPDGKVYTVEGNEITESNGLASLREYMSRAEMNTIKESNAKAYQNKMENPDKLIVKYFERAPYKGLPAEVPFDVIDGWYVEMTYVLSGFGVPYDESGKPVNYYICNVGANGRIEFKKSADDICRYYNGNTAELDFPGMDTTDSRNLIVRAQRAIAEAAQYYGKSRVTISGHGGQSFGTGISLGGEEGKCTDFMSPGDCKLLFNVCDPVICPSSRCDLGGKFRVDNVIQSGIIGSLMLCLPNAKEGIAIPICLSGVHAGIEGYLSILKSTRACLNESLETGRNIGICDEIKSVYLCEFFWKQASPFLNVIIPRLVESLYSQGARGGGEYLTVQNAWDNTQASIDYFKNDYAVNSMNAFNKRSTEEIGTEVCKSFMSANVPNSANFFDTLTEPDSPEQYSAWFSEDTLTTATVPATSHYKVYFHIFAGNDAGAYYVVYLKDLPPSNYINTMNTYVVDRNYIARGQEVDQAIDFTAVSGYKQLCISINGQDKCGFGKVSTSYFLNTLTDSYAKEQAKQTDIKSEKQCVAGTPSAQSLLQPNLQAGAQEIVQPELYNHGIIRVCATYNPGKQVTLKGTYDTANSTYDRWKPVGYCDDPKMICWLDTNSVEDVITDKNITKEVLDKVNLNALGVEDYWTSEKSNSIATEAQTFIGKRKEYSELNTIAQNNFERSTIDPKISDIVKKLTDLTNLGLTNRDRARGMYLLGELYGRIASYLKAPENEVSSITKTPEQIAYEEECALLKGIIRDKCLGETPCGMATDVQIEGKYCCNTECEKGQTGTTEIKTEEGRIYFKQNWAVGSWPTVNNLTFKQYEIDLVDTKFVKSIDGPILYYTTDKTEDKLGGTWRIPDSKQTNTYNSGKDFLSEEVRINFKENWAVSSSPIVGISTYKRFEVNGQDTKFVRKSDGTLLYFSTDGGVTWEEANNEMIIVYKEHVSIGSEKTEEVSETNQEKTIRITAGSWLKSSTPEVLIDSYIELNVNGEKTKFIKSSDEKAIYTSTNFEVDKFEGYWKKADSEQLQVYLNN